MANTMTRQAAYDLLCKYNESVSLRRHAMAVEGAMRHWAGIYGEDPEQWGVVGLLHDLDYEKYPDEHCAKSAEILREYGADEELIHAVQSHGYGLCCDVEPVTDMENVLYTIDELTGLINAAAIMRPSKSVLDLELKSVKKKFKDAHFAAGVDREVITKGAMRLNKELEYIIEETIKGMRACAADIGLAGDLA